MTRPFLSHEHPIRFAHRGGRALWPENTMAAFQGAVDLGYQYVETDLRATRDGVLLTFHDRHLEHLTNGTGRVRDWRLEELRHLDAGYRFQPDEGYPHRGTGLSIPTLEEVMTTFPDVKLNLDLKAIESVALLAEFVERHRVHDRVLAASFLDDRIWRFRRLTGDAVATSAGPGEVATFWATSRAGAIARTPADAFQIPVRRGPVRLVDDRFVRAAHGAGKQVHVWTVNDPGEMHTLLDLGVDGIVSDRPDILDEVVQERRGSP